MFHFPSSLPEKILKARAGIFIPARVDLLAADEVGDDRRGGRVEAHHVQHAAIGRVSEGEAVGGQACRDGLPAAKWNPVRESLSPLRFCKPPPELPGPRDKRGLLSIIDSKTCFLHTLTAMIKISSYDNRLELIEIEFQFLRFAITALSTSKKHKFFSDISRGKLDRLNAGLKKVPPELMEPAEIEALKAHAQKRFRKQFAPGNRQVYAETIQDGTNASEILIRVALFEAFMKDIHAEVLRARPTLLAKIRPGREVKYEHIFTDAPSFQSILNQQILREIDEVDRLPFIKRAEHFEKHLNLPMADAETLKFVGEIMKLRNEISHENPFKTISPEDLKKAISALKQIPTRVCNKARIEYGENFFQ